MTRAAKIERSTRIVRTVLPKTLKTAPPAGVDNDSPAPKLRQSTYFKITYSVNQSNQKPARSCNVMYEMLCVINNILLYRVADPPYLSIIEAAESLTT